MGVTSRVNQAIPAAVSLRILPVRVHSAQVSEKERKGKIGYQNEFDWKLRDETQPHNGDQQSKRKSEEVPFISLKAQVLNHPAEEESQKYKDEQEDHPRRDSKRHTQALRDDDHGKSRAPMIKAVFLPGFFP